MYINGKKTLAPSDCAPSPWQGLNGVTYEVNERQRAAARLLSDKIARNVRNFRLPSFYTHRVVLVEHYEFPALDQVAKFICPVTSASRDRTKICVIDPQGKERWVTWKK